MSKYFALVCVCFLLCAFALEGQAVESKEKSAVQLSSAEQEALNLPDTPKVGETDVALLGAMYGDKGRVLQRLGMPEGALKAYNTGLSLSPNDNYLHLEKGRLRTRST